MKKIIDKIFYKLGYIPKNTIVNNSVERKIILEKQIILEKYKTIELKVEGKIDSFGNESLDIIKQQLYNEIVQQIIPYINIVEFEKIFPLQKYIIASIIIGGKEKE